MGGGLYSQDSRTVRATTKGYFKKQLTEVFEERELTSEMDPNGVVLRESRDSKEHPNSVPLIVGLDVTGSMGFIPHEFVKDGLPTLMSNIIEKGVPDPQLLFTGIGDHKTDSAPFQVGQFESSDELLDKWLTKIWLEGYGGGNSGESYLLAWYFAATRTSLDSFEKRGKKGYLFTIGDEPVHSSISSDSLEMIFGKGEYSNYTAKQLLEEARKMYHVYHIHTRETFNGQHTDWIEGWQKLMGKNLIVMENKKNLAGIISEIIVSREATSPSANTKDESPQESEEVSDEIKTPGKISL